jgi:hypothetical protein
VKGVSAGEVAVGSVSVKVMVVVMMTVYCHRGGRQHKQKCSRSDQPEFRHDRSPFTADMGVFFAIPNNPALSDRVISQRQLAVSRHSYLSTLEKAVSRTSPIGCHVRPSN